MIPRGRLPGPYHEFEVLDPKRRLVSAARFRDRVVHHAPCNVVGPLFEPRLIFYSYACRKGKGTHAAADRATRFARASKHVLQCHVSDYFASIDHEILLGLLERKIGCTDTMWLIERIIGSGGGRSAGPVYHLAIPCSLPMSVAEVCPWGTRRVSSSVTST